MPDLDPIGTEIIAAGCRFRIVGYKTRDGKQVPQHEFLGPATGKAAKSKGVTVKPPALPANVTAGPTVAQKLALPKPAKPKQYRCHRRRSRLPVRLRHDPQTEPNVGAWLLGIFLALVACGFMGDCRQKADTERTARIIRGAR
jgi:hypothetical protein